MLLTIFLEIEKILKKSLAFILDHPCYSTMWVCSSLLWFYSTMKRPYGVLERVFYGVFCCCWEAIKKYGFMYWDTERMSFYGFPQVSKQIQFITKMRISGHGTSHSTK